MKGMILAAGVGSRLGELTQHTPKCLVEAGGKTLLEHTLLRLMRAGVDNCTVNLHHLAKEVEKFLDTTQFPSITINRSFESQLLETGGGVKAAKGFLTSGASSNASFFVHNADVYTTLELTTLQNAHLSANAAATLVVVDKPSTRGLLVDSNNRLCGWVGRDSNKRDFKRVVIESPDLRLVNFCGIQICSEKIFQWMEPLGSYFSIIEAYLAGINAGELIQVMPLPSDKRWFDVGTPERLNELRLFLR